MPSSTPRLESSSSPAVSRMRRRPTDREQVAVPTTRDEGDEGPDTRARVIPGLVARPREHGPSLTGRDGRGRLDRAPGRPPSGIRSADDERLLRGLVEASDRPDGTVREG